MNSICVECGRKGFKRGWTNSWYCSEQCEREGVSRLHASMPSSGPLPRTAWVPHHISIEISERWTQEERG
jgi:hypothetical protein